MSKAVNGLRALTPDELDAVAGGETHTRVEKLTIIGMNKGTLVIGTVSTDGGPALPYADWIPA